MRILSGIVALALGLGVGCAGRTDTASTAGQGSAAPPAAQAGGAGAQAAAQMPPDALDGIMKKVGPTNGAMRKKLMGGMVMDAATDAKTLATLFGDVERFWTQYKKQDAVMWAAEARKHATEAAGAAAAGDGAKAQMAADNMLGMCKQCHGTYREMAPDGTLRIKPGVLTE